MTADRPTTEPRTELHEFFAQAIRYGMDVEVDYYGNGQDDEEYIDKPAAEYAEKATEAAPLNPPLDALDVDTLLAAERVVEGWDEEISEGGMAALIHDLKKRLEQRVAVRLTESENRDDR